LRNVLVTGASRGVGLAIARRLADNGYVVVALSRSVGPPLAAAIEASAGTLRHIQLDLSDIAAIPGAVRRLKSEVGPLWGLINNAGVSAEGLLANTHNAEIEAVVRLNTVAPIVLTKYVVRGMMAAGGGRIINISSIVGSTGYGGLSVYSATKASLIGFTKSLAREVGRLGVTVNAVAPGFMDTDMTASLTEEGRAKVARRSALGRLADVEDVAGVVEFLLSESARNITGAVLTVDAGNTA
jgi:3-oxoacyl-[acyl-carrier protein] reductase